MPETLVTFRNTPENARRVGWSEVEEYCVGDQSLPWVQHDTVKGVFYFLETPRCPTCKGTKKIGGGLFPTVRCSYCYGTGKHPAPEDAGEKFVWHEGDFIVKGTTV